MFKINMSYGVIFLLLILFVNLLKKKFRQIETKEQQLFFYVLFVEHILIAIKGYYYVLNLEFADCKVYYELASKVDHQQSFYFVGHSFFEWVYKILIFLGFDFSTIFTISSLMSFIPFLTLFSWYIKLKNVPKILGIPIWQYTLLLPSFHFWSVIPGKDLGVFYILIFLIKKLRISVRLDWIIAINLLLLLLIRPYVGIYACLFFLFYYLKNTNKKISITRIYVTSFLMLSVFVFFIIQFLKIQTLDKDYLIQRYNEIMLFIKNNGEDDVVVQIGYFGRLIMLLGLPLFYNCIKVGCLIVSFENALLMSFLIYGIFFLFFKKKINLTKIDAIFALYIGLSVLLSLSIYMYNFGLAARMRLMFYPLLYYFISQILNGNQVENEKE